MNMNPMNENHMTQDQLTDRLTDQLAARLTGQSPDQRPSQFINPLTDRAFPISALVARYGVAAQSLRNWEEQGLIPPAIRTPGGHRRYGGEHIDALDRLFTLSIDALMRENQNA
jgi:hypothetical protein